MKGLKSFSSPVVLFARLEKAVIDLAGRRGVVAARAQLEMLKNAAAIDHRQMFSCRSQRLPEQIQRGRQQRRDELADAARGYPMYAMDRPAGCASHPAWRIVAPDRLLPDVGLAQIAGWWVHATENVSRDYARQALAILRQKSKAIVRQQSRMVDQSLCKELGFCDAGVKQFCYDFDLDPAGSYTGQQVADAVRAVTAENRRAVAPYVPELRILASTIGLKVAEFA